MTIDPKSASLSLTDVAHVERRTREALRYGGASVNLFWWGALTTVGYILDNATPAVAGIAWQILMITGIAGSFAIGHWYCRRGVAGTGDQRIFYALVALFLFGTLWTRLFGTFTGRGLDAFWPTLFMFGFVIAGFWVGRFFVVIGLVVTALTIVGFLWSGPLFPLWMAAVNGGGLIAGGVWLRRLRVSR